MNRFLPHFLILSAIVLAISSLPACKATEISNVKTNASYNPRNLRRVFVVAVVKTERVQKMLEDEFVRQLKSRGREAVASYTLVPHDTKMEPEAWKSMISSHGWDSIVISRLVTMEENETEVRAKALPVDTTASGYGYYGSAWGAVYQPSSYNRDQTAAMETKVFDVANHQEVWSARSTTEIAWGGDPEPQIRKFVSTLMSEASR